jgi:Na+/H+ antiporter NhaD/arsenite permease-like protein
VVIVAAALLSAVFTNDIVCLAMAPVLAEACLRRGSTPCPSCWRWPAPATSARR